MKPASEPPYEVSTPSSNPAITGSSGPSGTTTDLGKRGMDLTITEITEITALSGYSRKFFRPSGLLPLASACGIADITEITALFRFSRKNFLYLGHPPG